MAATQLALPGTPTPRPPAFRFVSRAPAPTRSLLLHTHTHTHAIGAASLPGGKLVPGRYTGRAAEGRTRRLVVE